MNTRKVAGIIGATAIFLLWILVDMIYFPPLLGSISYPMYELIVYGSWIVVILIVLFVLSMSGAIPTPKNLTDPTNPN